MKSKLLISSVILASMVTGCSMLKPQDKYSLKDTWGTDGNWGKTTRVAESVEKKTPVKHEEHNAPVTTKEKPLVKHEEAKPGTPKEAVHEEPAGNSQAESPVSKTADAYNNDKFGYSVSPAADWQQKDTFGPVGAFYVKEKDGSNLNFSVGAIKNLKAADLNPKFKQAYLKQLAESFPQLHVISTSDENIKGQKAWAVNYSFEKNGKKLQQKQVFIPHKDNTLVMNWISSDEGFFKGEGDFKAISNNLVLN